VLVILVFSLSVCYFLGTIIDKYILTITAMTPLLGYSGGDLIGSLITSSSGQARLRGFTKAAIA
jgi:hypothetical protein